MAERHVSIPKSIANGDMNEWFKRYEICCKANEATIALKLPTLLEGKALNVWLELSEEQQQSYATAKKELCIALIPIEFVSLNNSITPCDRAKHWWYLCTFWKSSSSKPSQDWMRQPDSKSYCTNFLLEYQSL